MLNLFFDWFLIGASSPWGDLSPINLGVNGLVFSTTFVNFFACIILLLKLHNKLDNFNLTNLLSQNLRIILIGFISGISSFFIYKIIYLPNDFLNLFLKKCVIAAVLLASIIAVSRLILLKLFIMILL